MVFRKELTYNEIVDIWDVKKIAGSTTSSTLLPSICEIADIDSMLKSLLPNKLKINITSDNIRLQPNLTTNKTIRFTKIFFYTILGFTQSHSRVLVDIDGYIQLIPGTYKKTLNLLKLLESIKLT